MKLSAMLALAFFALAVPSSNQKVVVNSQKSNGGESCHATPLLAFLRDGTGTHILDAYGYDLREPWACTNIESPILGGAIALRFRRITAETDEHTTFSVIKAPNSEYVWIIPTSTGMLEVSHAESDPHNIAAFNAVLGLHRASLSISELWQAGKLFMALLGHNSAAPLTRATENADVSSAPYEFSISFSDRAPTPDEAFNKWTITFEIGSRDHATILSSIARETVQPKQ